MTCLDFSDKLYLNLQLLENSNFIKDVKAYQSDIFFKYPCFVIGLVVPPNYHAQGYIEGNIKCTIFIFQSARAKFKVLV